MSRFYVVEKAGVPAVWQSEPEQLPNLLKRKSGFVVTDAGASGTRKGALVLLRQLFPGHRPIKTKTVE
jgi:hypothetical protein